MKQHLIHITQKVKQTTPKTTRENIFMQKTKCLGSFEVYYNTSFLQKYTVLKTKTNQEKQTNKGVTLLKLITHHMH